MKVKHILSILGILAIASCRMSTPVDQPLVSTDQGTYQLGADGGDVTVTVYSTVDWKAVIYPGSSRDNVDDVSVFPTAGGAGTTTLTVHMGKNEDYNRSALISLTGDFVGSAARVEQEGALGELIQEITVAEFLENKDDDSIFYILTGKITKVTQSDRYSNFYLDDGTGEIYIYGLYDGKNGPQFTDGWLDRNGVNVGWHFKIGTTRGSYKGTPEGMKTYPIEWTEPTDPMLTCADPKVTAAAADLSAKFALKVANLEQKWTVALKEECSWVTDYTKEGTESGDITVTLAANTTMKQRTATFVVSSEGAEDLELTLVQTGRTDVDALTIAEFIAKPVDTEMFYALTGTVFQIVDGEQYSNFYLKDETGTIYVAGLYDGVGGKEYTDGQLNSKGIKVGDQVTIWSSRGDWGIPIAATSVLKDHKKAVSQVVVNPATLTLPATGTVASFAIEFTNMSGSWTVEADGDYPWVTEYSAGGTDNGTLTVVVLQNTTGAERSASFTIRVAGVADPLKATLTQQAP